MNTRLMNNPRTLSISIGMIAMIFFMALLTHFYPPQYCHPIDRAMGGGGHVPFVVMNQEHLSGFFTNCVR